MMNRKILADNYLPIDIDGRINVVQAWFRLKKVGSKKLVGVVTLKMSIKLSVDNVSIQPETVERSIDISQKELDKLLPDFVQKAYLEDRVIGIIPC
jgi:hypothetical protein